MQSHLSPKYDFCKMRIAFAVIVVMAVDADIGAERIQAKSTFTDVGRVLRQDHVQTDKIQFASTPLTL